MIKTLSTCSEDADVEPNMSIISENYHSPNFYETNWLREKKPEPAQVESEVKMSPLPQSNGKQGKSLDLSMESNDNTQEFIWQYKEN